MGELKLCYRPSELPAILGISRCLVYALLRKGKLPSIKLGRAILIPKERLELFLSAGEPKEHQT
jgi:excisionase family DNA binding protein